MTQQELLKKLGGVEAAPNPAATPLPALREELTLHPGPPGGDGSPTWSLQDPVRNLFFRIDWPTFEILSRWDRGTAGAVAVAIEKETTLSADVDDVMGVVKFLIDNELLLVRDAAGSRRYADIAQRRRSGWGKWLLHHYLFFRLPLFRPDRLLEKMQPWVMPFFSRTFLNLTFLALAIGLIEVSRQWESFSATLIDTFSWQGIAGYGLALIFVKILHEFGHALTAKRFGCRVPVMGVAFLVMWPMAYTDVNEIWKLPQRRRRFTVSAAGIATELILAAWATLAWAFLPDGFLRSSAFLIATTTWVSTLAINASPFMRFDGYFLLCDWLDMPNLHQRSFALARWQLREFLFGLNDPLPEHLPKARHRGLIAFAYLTWIYRLVIFLGIAALVYGFFVKILGIFLFLVEISWFIALPVWSELRVWWQRREAIRAGARTRTTLRIGLLVLLLTVIPWKVGIESQGMLRPTRTFPLVTPVSAWVVDMPVTHGMPVAKQALLINLESPELIQRETSLRQRVASLRWQVAAASVDTNLRAKKPVLEEDLSGANAELDGIIQELARLQPTAPFAGTLLDLPPDLAPGQWLPRNTQIAILADTTDWHIDTYLPERELARVTEGDWGRFISETAGGPSFWLKVERIDRNSTRALTEPMLSTPHGGEVVARLNDRTVIPEQAMFRISLRVVGAVSVTQLIRGHVTIYGTPKTFIADFLKSSLGIMIRETGF